jgi:hypothetical protein
LAIWTSASGAASVCGATFSITRGVASAAEDVAEEVADVAGLALPLRADSDSEEGGGEDEDGLLVEDAELLLASDVSVALEAGGASWGDGGVAPVVVTGSDVVGLLVADVTGGGGVSDDGTSRGEGGAALVAAAVGGAGRADVTTGSGAGATGSGARVCGGASTVCWTVGTTTGGASTDDGICAAVDCSTGAWVTATVGSGAIVVVGTTGSVPGSANAGAIPPVSAVREMTTPDASTAQTVRLRQISNGARIVQRLLRSLPRHRFGPAASQCHSQESSAIRRIRYIRCTRGRAGGTAASRARV